MPCLIEAFKQMRRRGLVARRECYCEHCSQDKILETAKKQREQHKEVRGFVHVAECDPVPTLEELRVPLVFGLVTGKRVRYQDPGCLAVGEVVAECLNEQGIQYEWDRLLGHPILVVVDPSLSGLPKSGHPHEIPLSEDLRAFRTLSIPEEAYDKIEGNPVKLLNLAKLRRLNLAPPHLRGPRWQPAVGDHVKLGFFVPDALAPLARKEGGPMIDRVQLESMSVEVTKIINQEPEPLYRGELLDRPIVIDPAKLRIGSPVQFTADMIYPVQKRDRRHARA